MQTIYKYAIPFGDNGVVQMPAGAKPLSVGMQGNKMFVWARVDTEREPLPYPFSVRGAGRRIRGNEGDFIGTVQTGTGFVWHVFWSHEAALDS